MRYKNSYVPEVKFQPDADKVIQTYISPKINNFFQSRGIHTFCEIKANEHITDLDFESVKFKYFYKGLLKSIRKENGTINSIFYAITHDKNLAVLHCEETGILFNQLCLGEQPILYFLYFNLQEFFDVIRSPHQPLHLGT